MGISVFPAASAASKTMFRTTLTSGTSYTVPTGVTYLNVILYGGGGGGGGARDNSSGIGSNGGTTTFTGATSAAGGNGGQRGDYGQSANNGPAAVANSSTGGNGGWAPNGGSSRGMSGDPGNMIASTLSATPGATIAYAIGAGGSAGFSNNDSSGAGASGKIIVEYWAQEITMERVFAVIEDNKVVNIIVGVEDEVVAANPGKYIEYTNGWDYNNGIDGGRFFPLPVVEETIPE